MLLLYYKKTQTEIQETLFFEKKMYGECRMCRTLDPPLVRGSSFVVDKYGPVDLETVIVSQAVEIRSYLPLPKKFEKRFGSVNIEK